MVSHSHRIADGGTGGNPPGRPERILCTDRHIDPHPETAIRRMQPGDALLLRDYDHPERGAYLATLMAEGRQRGLRCIVAGDAALAARLGADGLHLPRWWQGELETLRQQHPAWWVTMSVHDKNELSLARHRQVDAILISPVFQTLSHPGQKGLGLWGFARLCWAAPMPAYAMGGVNIDNYQYIKWLGAAGYAGIRGVATAP